jgi:TRAP-type C4-dicarboxylate transport system substrate-binding protein
VSLAASAEAETFNWRFFSVSPASHPYAQVIIEGLKQIDERTDGQLKIEFVNFSETPYKPGDALSLVRDGLVETTEWTPTYTASTYPLAAAPELPFISPEHSDAAAFEKATNAAWDTPVMKAEAGKVLDEYKAAGLARWYYEPLNFWFVQNVRGLDDFKGKKIRVASPEAAEMVSALGASPVQIFPAEVFTALQRGTIDGVITGSGNIKSFKWDEVLKSMYRANMQLVSSVFVVSNAAMEKLPPDLQAVLTDEMSKVQQEIQDLMPEKDASQVEALKAEGLTVTEPTAEDYAGLRSLAEKNVWTSWKAQAGEEADKVLEAIGSARP